MFILLTVVVACEVSISVRVSKIRKGAETEVGKQLLIERVTVS